MRRGVPGLASPHSLTSAMPAIYLEDQVSQRFVAALDEALAPVLLTLDCLDAYLDPALAPADFLDWLAAWVCAPVDPSWSEPLRRRLIRDAVELHRWRGTVRGVEAAVRLVTGGEVVVTDSGAATASATPSTAPAPAAAPATVHVLVRVANPATVDRRRLDRVVDDAVPAHVRPSVEVVGT